MPRKDGGTPAPGCEGHTILHACADVARHPVDYLVRRWNWKSAVMSAVIRGALFFGTNASVSHAAASRAATTEAAYAFATAGFYGALTEAFRLCEPPELSNLTVSLGLPAIAHSCEFVVHWLRGTPRLATSIGWSVALSIVTTSFNMFAMRRGAELRQRCRWQSRIQS